MVVYLTEQGSTLHMEDGRYVVKKDGNVISWFHAKDVDTIIIMGKINLTISSITNLLKETETVFLDYNGMYKGRLINYLCPNNLLRYKQFQTISCNKKKMLIAREVVRAKITNSLYIIKKRLGTKNKRVIRNIKKVLSKIENCENFDVLRGIEGQAAKSYYSLFPKMLKNTELKFNGRSRRPPLDEVNALLSLGYAFLQNKVFQEIKICGLDAYFGFLHELDYGRESLVLDLMEEFRSLIDDFVLTLCNRREMRPLHFEYTPEEEFSIKLSKDGFKIFALAFNKLMENSVGKTDVSFKKQISRQCRSLVKYISQEEEYKGFILD